MLDSVADPERATAYRRQLMRAAPVGLLVPVGLSVVLVVAGVQLQPLAIAVGAIGWVVALAARGPIAAVLRARGDEQLTSVWFVAASGPTEELVRLAVVLLLGRDLDTALSIGLGWGAIEVIFTIVQGFAMAVLMERDDPEARRIRAVVPAPPTSLLEPSAPWWGVVERVWASVLHLAFTAILAAQPILVIATIPAHTATNVLMGRVAARWPLGRVELAGALWTAAIALVAWSLW